MRMLFAIMMGLVFWFPAQIMGLGLAAGGHGWGGPFFYSMFLAILYPIAFARAFGSTAAPSSADAVILAAGGVLDLFLLMSASSESKYIAAIWRSDDGPLFIILWLILWFAWQILLAASLLWRKRGGPRARA
ncbi:MAG TPA: hypothetical protein VF548_13360 [Allosphingosinicella sp.]|jgi:hypothetical protein